MEASRSRRLRARLSGEFANRLSPERTRRATLFERLTVRRLQWETITRLNRWLELLGRIATYVWAALIALIVLGLDLRQTVEDVINSGEPVRAALLLTALAPTLAFFLAHSAIGFARWRLQRELWRRDVERLRSHARVSRSRRRLSLRLPEGYLPSGGHVEDASPPRGALAWLELDRCSQPSPELRGASHVGDLHVGEPQSGIALAFDHPALDPVAELQAEIGARAHVNRLRLPAEQPRVEGTGARQVAGAQLQVHYGIDGSRVHPLPLGRTPMPQLIGPAMTSAARLRLSW